MDNYRKYSSTELEIMNCNTKYPNWIININELKKDEEYILIETGDYCFFSGRQYVAIPANKKLTKEDILKYNIML